MALQSHTYKTWTVWLALLGPAKLLDGFVNTVTLGFLMTDYALDVAKLHARRRFNQNH